MTLEAGPGDCAKNATPKKPSQEADSHISSHDEANHPFVMACQRHYSKAKKTRGAKTESEQSGKYPRAVRGPRGEAWEISAERGVRAGKYPRVAG